MTAPILKTTVSLCGQCYKQVPAVLRAHENQVVIEKHCSEHGPSTALAERSLPFYAKLQQVPVTKLYNHLVLDVTTRCQMRCDFCYFPLTTDPTLDPRIANLVQAVQVTPYQPILSGGDPTTREDLPELIEALWKLGHTEVMMLTNGLKLEDFEYACRLATAGLGNPATQTFGAALSLHGEARNSPTQYRQKLSAIHNVTTLGYQLADLMFTVESLEEAEALLPVFYRFRHATKMFRIRGAFNNWHETKADPAKRLYVSDFMGLFHRLAKAKEVPLTLTPNWDHGLYHVTIQFDGMPIRLIAAPDVTNVDLLELQCGPFHRSQSGEMLNLFHSFMINEGIAKGWLHGRKL